jgi:hypothetical protein
MDPAKDSKSVEAAEVHEAIADTVQNSIEPEVSAAKVQNTSEPEMSAAEAEYVKARAQGPAASTEITPIIPVTGYGDSQSKKSRSRNGKAGKFKAAAASSAGKFKGVFDKPVTRKFLAAALGLTLVLNGAIAAGIMSLYSHGIKKDVSEVRQTVSELEQNSGNSGNFGGPDIGMTPPDWNNGGNDGWNNGNDNGWNNGGDDSWDNGNGWNNGNDNGWNSGNDSSNGYGDDNGYYGGDSDYHDNWNDDWDDDWDDNWNNQSAPSFGGEQG